MGSEIFNQLLLKIDSDLQPLSRPHWKEESQGFPTVYGMSMENFFSKNPVIGKLCGSRMQGKELVDLSPLLVFNFIELRDSLVC